MKIAVVGATGKVGRMMLTCLDEFAVEIDKIDLYASKNSVDSIVEFRGQPLNVFETTTHSFDTGYDFVLFSAGGAVAKEFAPHAVNAGSVVIDNSSAFRRDDAIPLVVPEINGHLLDGYKGIIANPNCSTIQLVLLLYPLSKYRKIKKIVVTTLQSVSGSGYKGIMEMQNQRKGSAEVKCYTRQIDLNVIPQIGDIRDDLFCEEEAKMTSETKKILGDSSINLVATTVRVPVVYGHSESVYVEFEESVSIDEIKDILSNTDAVSHSANYMTPIELGDSNLSHVSRIRYGGDRHSILFWNVAHNVRLGAATNAVKILKYMQKYS